jgi:Uma2 family endonuclease
MSTQTLIDLDAIGHLPSGATLILTDISWEEYEQLLAFLGDSSGARVTYDNGRLEIMSPSQKHENLTKIIERLVYAIAEETGVAVESLGSTTYKQEVLARGVEPDACFYIKNADRIIGNEGIDLKTDPPPDIVVEIDISHESKTKFAIYAGMGVSELWHYADRQARIYSLIDQRYVEISASGILPFITGEVLSRFLEQSNLVGQTATLKSFREWLRSQTS